MYRTRVYRTGKVDAKGILHGDLILQGSGDPLLSPNDLKALAQKVKDRGINRLIYDYPGKKVNYSIR